MKISKLRLCLLAIGFAALQAQATPQAGSDKLSNLKCSEERGDTAANFRHTGFDPLWDIASTPDLKYDFSICLAKESDSSVDVSFQPAENGKAQETVVPGTCRLFLDRTSFSVRNTERPPAVTVPEESVSLGRICRNIKPK